MAEISGGGIDGVRTRSRVGRRARWAAALTALTILSLIPLARVAPPAEAAPAVDTELTAAPAFDNTSRASVGNAYMTVLKPALDTPLGWTGNVNGCVPGAPSPAAQNATLTAVNFMRELAGLAPVTFNAGLSADAQKAALMMDAADDLSHFPDPTWPCHTAAGAAAAGKSNLHRTTGSTTGARAIAGYMVDPGAGNTGVGHRRWILYPLTTVMGSGTTSQANALYVIPPSWGPRPASPEWVPWPTKGYFPTQLEPEGRWSLSANDPDTDFSAANVTVTSGGQTIADTVVSRTDNYGDPTIVWELDPGHSVGQADKTYTVRVTNIVRDGQTITHEYDVTLFDATLDPAQTITFADPADRVYGDGPLTMAATATSNLPVSFTTSTPAVCTSSGTNGTSITLLKVGTCTVNANQAGNGTFNPAPQVTRSFDVNKKALTVTADDLTREIGDANPELTTTVTGFVLGEDIETSGVTGNPSCSTTATVASPLGTYPITCTIGTLVATNYSFTFAAGTLTVTPAVPGPPTEVEAEPGDRRATVTWGAPADTGGGPLTGYRITRSPGGQTTDVGPGTTSATITSLTIGTPYTFTVQARNAAGLGPASAASPAVTPVGFTDVASNHPFHADIIWLAITGITTGYSDGTFRPNDSVNRQSMAAFLYRNAGSPPYTPPTNSQFPDVPKNHPFFKEIHWLASTGITTGYSDGTYRPNDRVNRQSMAAFLFRAAGSPPYTPPTNSQFPDVAKRHPFFKEIHWLAATGISTGYTDGTYRPNDSVNRQSMAAFLHRFDTNL